jgi:hypothetical protein
MAKPKDQILFQLPIHTYVSTKVLPRLAVFVFNWFGTCRNFKCGQTKTFVRVASTEVEWFCLALSIKKLLKSVQKQIQHIFQFQEEFAKNLSVVGQFCQKVFARKNGSNDFVLKQTGHRRSILFERMWQKFVQLKGHEN